MNHAELRASLERRTGVAFDATAQTEFLNDALRATAAAADWPWLEATQTITLVAGTAAYALPTGYLDTRSVKLSDGEPVTRVAVEDGDRWDSWQAAPSCGYAIEGDTIVFFPTPAAADTVTHRYTVEETELSADGDEPLLPATFHPAVVCYAAKVMMDRLDQPRRADRFESEFNSWLRQMQPHRHRGGRRTVRLRNW